MKNFWILLLFSSYLALNVQSGFAQTDTVYLYQTFPSFSNQEKAEWTAFENNWNYVEYSVLKKKYKIKNLNCKNCNSFYGDIYFEINEVGELSFLKFKKGKLCGQSISNKFLIKAFEESLKAQTFNYLKNRQFIAKFGNVLKC